MDLDFVTVLTLACCRDFPDLDLEFALRDQGMGARRGAAPGTHAAGAQGRGIAARFLADRELTRISLRIETLDVPPQDMITRDNVSVKVNAVCYFRVVDANLALSQVQNYLYATSQQAQTTCAASSASSNWTRFSPSAKR